MKLRPRVSLLTTTVVLAIGCTSPTPEPSAAPTTPRDSATSIAAPGNWKELAAQIRGNLDEAIRRQGLPYVVTQTELQDAKDVRGGNLPEGPWLVIQFDDPGKTGAGSDLTSRELLLEKPLEVWRDGVQPIFPRLDFVVNYVLGFRDVGQTVFQASPLVMRLYVRGEITTKDMVDKIVITGIPFP